VDLSLFKDFRVSESKRVQFRAECFNTLNHPNFGLRGKNFNLFFEP
jgi:hypothetical protein